MLQATTDCSMLNVALGDVKVTCFNAACFALTLTIRLQIPIILFLESSIICLISSLIHLVIKKDKAIRDKKLAESKGMSSGV